MASSAALSSQFYAEFQRKAAAITASTTAGADIDRASAAAQVAELAAALTDATVYLPAYDQRKLQQQLRDLQASLASTMGNGSATQRKSKFSFAKRAPAAIPAQAAATSTTPSTPAASPAVPPSGHTSTSTAAAGPGPTTMRTIASRRAARVTAPQTPESTGNADSTYSLTLTSLEACVVHLLAGEVGSSPGQTLTAVYAEDLERTIVLLPRDLKGSIMLSRLRRCIVVAGCQQFRIHNSSDCLILLDIPSHPILERSSGLRFGPYPSTLGGSAGEKISRHGEAQDFDWLRPGQSPNWRRIEPDELQAIRWVDIARQTAQAEGPELVDVVEGVLMAAGL